MSNTCTCNNNEICLQSKKNHDKATQRYKSYKEETKPTIFEQTQNELEKKRFYKKKKHFNFKSLLKLQGITLADNLWTATSWTEKKLHLF